jgi:hypothetical protein
MPYIHTQANTGTWRWRRSLFHWLSFLAQVRRGSRASVEAESTQL